MQKELLSTQDLHKIFTVRSPACKKQSFHAVNGLDLAVDQGDVFGLVGESGCGKSTAGQLIAGIVPKSEGTITYRGKILPDQADWETRKNIQMIFQDPYAALNPKKKIGWIMEEPLKIHTNLKKKERQERVVEMMALIGLDKAMKGAYPSQLSGGQRQRVNIAATLLTGANFIIADESVSALDLSIQSQILNLMLDLKEKLNLTYLFISHDLNVIRYLSNKIGVMYMGRLVETGSCREVCENPRHPYTRMLLSAVTSVTGAPGERIMPMGEIPNPLSTPSGCPFHPRCDQVRPECMAVQPRLTVVGAAHGAACHNVK